ncbi:DUF89 domain-containing protein [Candidatus Latescibacterota bacterium]
MKAEYDCIPCIMKQALNTAIRATGDSAKIREILNSTADYVQTIDLEKTPADLSNFVYRLTKQVTGVDDPYCEDKKKYNDLCLSLLDGIRKKIAVAADPLFASIITSVFGNMIDLGIGHDFNVNEDIVKIFEKGFTIDDYTVFTKKLSSSITILFIGDNTGEIVFDIPFVEKLLEKHDVNYVVKSGPVINDATMSDAIYVGMTRLTKVIETGSDGIGVEWSAVSDEFRESFDKADVVISKGQGNFETLSTIDKDIFFLLKAKCDCIAHNLGVSYGDIVFKIGPVMDVS